MKLLNIRLLAPLSYMLSIFALSSIPDNGGPNNSANDGQLLIWIPPGLQNLLHIPLFGGLAACWYWAMRQSEISRCKKILFIAVISTTYALLDELHQTAVPGRFGSFSDFSLDVAGILITISVVECAKWIGSSRKSG